MDRFVIVKPTGTALNEKVGKWANEECEHAILHWHKQFRGEAMVKNDADVSEADIASRNLVLFGDRGSNKTIEKIAERVSSKGRGKLTAVGAKGYEVTVNAEV